jgi:heat shock 70kDa protein 1/2/6/8
MEEYSGCIGIDLGTTNSCVGVWENDRVVIIPNELGKNTTPSWIAFTETDRLIGEPARNQAVINPNNTLFDIKRIIGKRFTDEDLMDDINSSHYPFEIISDENDLPLINVEYKKKTQQFRPEQISAMLLSRMREIAENRIGKTVKNAVITVPAYFNDSQRTATRNAACIAGLNPLKIINEPTAACLCYGLEKNEDNFKVLIFDLGGGTFDVSVLNLCSGIFEVLATCGNSHLGGEDFDHTIMSKLLDEFLRKNNDFSRKELISCGRSMRKLKQAAERAKCILSNSLDARIELESFYKGKDFFTKISRNKFNLWCNSLFLKCLTPIKQVLADAQISNIDIDDIVLVGGSTRIPKIQEMLSKFFNGKQLNKSINPDEAVAYGAAVNGAILTKSDKSGKTTDLLLLDVTPLSLGIKSRGGVMSNIIKRNTQLPAKESKTYSTVEDRQSSVLIEIFEGEREFTKNNHHIGNFDLCGLPRLARGVPKIKVTFNINADGILTVTAADIDTGTSNDITVTETNRLSQEEINNMIDEADQFRAEDAIKKEALTSRYSFEKYLADIQNAVNDPQLTKDDLGDNILSEEHIAWLNTFILSNMTWLEENDDVSKEKIDEVKQVFEHNTKSMMYKIFTRKKQIDLKQKYRETDDTDDNETEKYIENMFSEMNDDSDMNDTSTVPTASTKTIKKQITLKKPIKKQITLKKPKKNKITLKKPKKSM